MINVLGENYFIDLDKVEEYLDIDEISDSVSGSTELRVNLVKFELIKMLFETILTEPSSMDDLGISNKLEKNTSIPFKLAFNTLLNKKLINHY